MERKAHIAFFGIKYFPSKGGTSRVAENLISRISGQCAVTVYCYKHPKAKDHIPEVRTVQFPEIPMGSFGVFLFYLLCFLHIIIFGRYDLIHAHKIDSFLFLKPLRWKTKVIATTHEIPYKREKWGGISRTYFKWSERQFVTFKGVKTSISEPLSRYYKDKLGIEVRFIPNGINVEDRSTTGSANTYWPPSVKPDMPYILFAARRIIRTKGLHTFLSALRQIEFRGHVFVAGEVDHSPEYMSRIHQLRNGLNVHFLGFVESLGTLLDLVHRSRYFVFPSETEGMSIMLLEVASSATPIIASDIPENWHIFEPDEVLYFRNKSVEDLAEKILWAENHGADFRAYGQKARQKVIERFTWDKIVIQYKELYENTLG